MTIAEATKEFIVFLATDQYFVFTLIKKSCIAYNYAIACTSQGAKEYWLW